jgi:hypothetical protein
LPQLPRAASKPDAPAIVRYVSDWLAVLEADPSRGPEFDRDLDLYAASLRQSGALTPHQGAGFLLALWSYSNVGNPLQEVLRQQVDRRAALHGLRHCRWRGTIRANEFDHWKWDEALRRSQLPNTGEPGHKKRQQD